VWVGLTLPCGILIRLGPFLQVQIKKSPLPEAVLFDCFDFLDFFFYPINPFAV
jgi:hypothetical protein